MKLLIELDDIERLVDKHRVELAGEDYVDVVALAAEVNTLAGRGGYHPDAFARAYQAEVERGERLREQETRDLMAAATGEDLGHVIGAPVDNTAFVEALNGEMARSSEALPGESITDTARRLAAQHAAEDMADGDTGEGTGIEDWGAVPERDLGAEMESRLFHRGTIN